MGPSQTLVAVGCIFAATLACAAEPPASDPAPKRPNLAPTPPMGWNSWNWFGKGGHNEKDIAEIIDAMATNGLKEAGYVYVVIDGGWRDNKLGPNGELVPHPTRYAGGIKPLADLAHAKGLKFGLHTCPGTHDCGGDPVGGLGHEKLHVEQFVEWGVDFIKLDSCRYTVNGKSQWNADTKREIYTRWGDLFAQCGRDIVFSASGSYGADWTPKICHMARTTIDIGTRTGASFEASGGLRGRCSVMKIALANNAYAALAGNGFWNDPDMLVIGAEGLTLEEQRTHFALWCIMTAPLFLGNDPRAMTQEEKDIVTNREAIAIDQDPTEQGRRLGVVVDGKLVSAAGGKKGADITDGIELWAKRLTGGRWAVLLFNRNAKDALTATFTADMVGLDGEGAVRDVYANQDVGTLTKPFIRKLPPHVCAFLVVTPTAKP